MEAIDGPISNESAVTSVKAVVEKEAASVVNDKASIINDEALIVIDEASIVNDEASIVNDEASIVNDESSDVNREDEIADEESSAPALKKSDIIDQNCNGNSISVENELNDAMASATISTTDTDVVKENQVEEIVGEKLKEEIAIVEEEVAVVVDNSDVSVKTLQQDQDKENSISSKFEDTLVFVDDEDNCIEELEKSDVIREEYTTADENCNNEQLKEGELNVVEEGKKDVSEGEKDVVEEDGEPLEADPKIPVPVDDDTNDPQYIPRRGRFYEHDDRMAYSTTSSEGSDSSNEYEDSEEYDEENTDCRERRRRRTTASKMRKARSEKNVVENVEQLAIDSTTPHTKKVLAISKVAAVTKDSIETPINPAFGSSKKLGSKKSRDIDSLDKWTHDMYNENEQTRKSKDELLASYGYDIREESEAPRARRHHKYGRAATAKYTRSWQDTKAYSGAGGGPQSPKVKQRGGIGRRNISDSSKIKNNSATSTEYSSEFPALDGKKPSGTSSAAESPAITTASNELHQEKKTNNKAITTGLSRQHTTSSQTSKYVTSPNPNHHQGQSNGEPGSLFHNKNSFKRPTDSSAGKDKGAYAQRDSPTGKDKSALSNRDSTGLTTNNNLFNRRPQQQHSGGHNYKLQNYSNHGGQGHNQYRQHSPPSLRGRNFHQNHNSQFNRDRYFAKGAIPPSSNSNHQNYDAPNTAGTGRTQHSGGHYHHYHRRYENDSEHIEQPLPPPPPVVRSSKRYSVQSRRELPDPVLNFGGMNKPLSQQQPTVPHQQQNGLVMQEQQSTMQQIQTQQMQTQQQPPIQMHQQQPPPIQLQQYHQSLQQIHTHHSMVLDHNTGMMVMAAADPTLYHHQLYAAPQYATAMPPGSAAVSTDDQNAVAAAAALQMLAAQAAVYQPVPTGATGLTSPPSGAQPETFMTTYYQPQQQPQQQPPPRRINLAIPIVAPPPEPMQQQSAPKTNPSPTPAAT